MTLADTLLKHFSVVTDFRVKNHNFRHKLSDILIIAILGAICGTDSFVELEEFGLAKEEWLRTFLELPHGIPSHDTFGRVFSILDPAIFEACFTEWLNSLTIDLTQEIIALDGKTLRGSGDKRKGIKALHSVSAWATTNRMMLAQVKTDEKSNEITAIPKLLKMLNVENSVITIDAIGCQTKIAKQIKNQKADYVLSLKENQKTLYEDVASIFRQAEVNKQKQYKNILHLRRVEKSKKKHGRHETRRYTLISARDPLLFQVRWPHLKGIGKVDIKRTVGNESTCFTRYFLTSLDYTDVDLFKTAVRKHWQIEIDLHWSLDVSFKEDHSQVRMGHAAENLAMTRRIALNLLKQENTHKRGISCKRKSAGWSNEYLLKVLQADRHFLEKEKTA